jgi:hypothetical protein
VVEDSQLYVGVIEEDMDVVLDEDDDDDKKKGKKKKGA